MHYVLHISHFIQKRLFNDFKETWTNLTVILADTQSIAINARAINWVAPINNKAPSLLVLLHHHDTQLSRLQIVPFGAPIDEQLLLSEDCTRSHKGHSLILVTLGLDQSTVNLWLGTIKPEQPLMGIKASVFRKIQLTLTRIGRFQT